MACEEAARHYEAHFFIPHTRSLRPPHRYTQAQAHILAMVVRVLR